MTRLSETSTCQRPSPPPPAPPTDPALTPASIAIRTPSPKTYSWIVKNSWSTAFANGGYINVQRGVLCAGMCDESGCGGGNLFTVGDPADYYE